MMIILPLLSLSVIGENYNGAYIEYSLFKGNDCSLTNVIKSDIMRCNEYNESSLSIICPSNMNIQVFYNVTDDGLVNITPLHIKECVYLEERNQSILLLSIIKSETVIPDAMFIFFSIFALQCVGAFMFLSKQLNQTSKEKVFESMVDHMSQYVNFVRSGKYQK